MAFVKMLRFSVSNICMRSLMGCDNKVLSSTLIQSKRYQHSGIGKDSIVQLPGAQQELGSVKSAVIKSESIQAIQFKKLLQDEAFIEKYRQRMMEIIEDIEIKPDNKNKVEDLKNIIMKTAQDVCGTSQKVLYKCDKCKDVFNGEVNLTRHQSLCTGLISEAPGKRKCDKCHKDFRYSHFPAHYITCQGIKANQMENKTPGAKRKCDKCLEEVSKYYFAKHYSICTGSKKDFVKCSKCGELFGNLGAHMKACTGLKADDPNKRKCDKCLKEFTKTNFPKHYRICKGIIETKSARVNCPDCGKEMNIKSLNTHKRLNCRGAEQRSKDEIFKESDLLSDILVKIQEDAFRIKDNSWINVTGEEIHQLRSRVTRVIKLTEAVPDYNEGGRGVCPDCGKKMKKISIKLHQKLHCPERLRENLLANK